MTPFIVYLLAVAVGLVVVVVMAEIVEGCDRRRRADEWAEFETWKRAREVTGRVAR